MKRSPIKPSRKPWIRKPSIHVLRRRRNLQGKKTKAWSKERRKLKEQSVRDGLTTCQLRYEGCTVNDFLSYAHPRKRRHLAEGELAIAILCCWNCHEIIERKPEDEMAEIVYKLWKATNEEAA